MSTAGVERRATAARGTGARNAASSRRRGSRLVAILLVLVTVLAAAAGVWGVLAPRTGHEPRTPAAVGQAVEVPGGLLRVERVIAEHMAPMNNAKFAKAGMNMSGMGMDMAPPGFRRFTVQVAFAGQARDGMRYTAEKFKVSGPGVNPPSGPLRHKLIEGALAPGSMASGSLLFQVPENARDLILAYEGGKQPVALGVPAGESNDHSHEAGEDGHKGK